MIQTSLGSNTLSSLFTLNNLQSQFGRTLTNLSTGSRINSASDDPPGMIASVNLAAALELLDAESSSLQRASNIVDTADAGMAEMSDQLVEARALEVQLANSGALSSEEEAAIQSQLDSIYSSIDSTARNTTFNDSQLLDGTASIVINDASLTLTDVTAGSLGESEISGQTYTLSDLSSGGALDGNSSARLTVVDAAISDIATARASAGAFKSNYIDSRINAIDTSIENVSSSFSFIADTNFASETADLSRLGILRDATLGAINLINSANQSTINILA